jgi:UDP-N-acetylglucosamine--N-acetylmuramyl-(pentapeptide) pyrophosphoryl-undecaprenol N-acetylglucosamine transferase
MNKKIMVVGGGSGGHLTPLIAVADQIVVQDPTAKVVFVGQKGENLRDIVEHESIHEHAEISAGKFRRYHGESFLKHLLDVKTNLLNVRDFFRFVWGLGEAWRLLGKQKPTAVFLKGGFVSVPIGIAARLRHIPYVTHDSDAIPGLANRLTAKHARKNTTAMPPEFYPYDHKKTLQVGIPLQPTFVKVDAHKLAEAKIALGLHEKDEVLFCVGGGLGAQKVNHALARSADEILKKSIRRHIFHVTGKKLYEETQQLYKDFARPETIERVHLIDFTTELYKYSAAADVVLTRAGATNIAEFAVQGKPCVVIPNPVLTGGQQLHNAKVLTDSGAAVVVSEQHLDTLADIVNNLLSDTALRQELGQKLNNLASRDAAKLLAALLLEI